MICIYTVDICGIFRVWRSLGIATALPAITVSSMWVVPPSWDQGKLGCTLQSASRTKGRGGGGRPGGGSLIYSALRRSGATAGQLGNITMKWAKLYTFTHTFCNHNINYEDTYENNLNTIQFPKVQQRISYLFN